MGRRGWYMPVDMPLKVLDAAVYEHLLDDIAYEMPDESRVKFERMDIRPDIVEYRLTDKVSGDVGRVRLYRLSERKSLLYIFRPRKLKKSANACAPYTDRLKILKTIIADFWQRLLDDLLWADTDWTLPELPKELRMIRGLSRWFCRIKNTTPIPGEIAGIRGDDDSARQHA